MGPLTEGTTRPAVSEASLKSRDAGRDSCAHTFVRDASWAATKEDGASAGICIWYQSAVHLFSAYRSGCWDRLLGWRWKA